MGVQPQETKIVFVIEDKTLFGTYYKTEKNNMDNPVILTDTLQLQESLNYSDVDCVIFGQRDNKMMGVAHKGDFLTDKIDLKTKEFFIVPAAPLFTFATKSK